MSFGTIALALVVAAFVYFELTEEDSRKTISGSEAEK